MGSKKTRKLRIGGTSGSSDVTKLTLGEWRKRTSLRVSTSLSAVSARNAAGTMD
jgi:hypothetical protein